MKNMMRNIVLIFLGALLWQGSFAQKRPEWTNGYFKDVRNSYIECVWADGYESTDAREKAMQQIAIRRDVTTGKDVNVSMQDNDIKIEGNHNLIIKARIIDEYIERIESGRYRVYLLVQTARNPTLEYEQVKVTRRYPVSPRILIPGMAQIHKGRTGRGAFFITTELIFASFATAFELQRSSYKSKIFKTNDLSERESYMKRIDRMKKPRDRFAIAAVAIYFWNLIDGIAAKGDSHVVVKKSKVKLTPYATVQSAGVSLSLNF